MVCPYVCKNVKGCCAFAFVMGAKGRQKIFYLEVEALSTSSVSTLLKQPR